MEVYAGSTAATKELAQRIAKKLKPTDVLALYGELGGGKTTFTRYLVEALGLNSRVQSPTFVLVREYTGGTGSIKKINHVDLYRLDFIQEIEELGLHELMDDASAITIIEWPEIFEKDLPARTIKISFKLINEHERTISVQNLD